MAWNPQMYMPNYMPQYPQPSSRMVEVMPVDTVEAAQQFPVAIGATVMFIGKDDSFIAVKINGVNGNGSFDVYDKRPPAPPQPVFDPAAYVTKEELEARLAAISRPKKESEE